MADTASYCTLNCGVCTGFYKYIHFLLMYTTKYILTFFLIKHFINQYGEPITPHKLATGAKPSVSNLRVLFFSCVVQKFTAHVHRTALNMRHHSLNKFGVSLLEFQNNKKVTSSTYLVDEK